MVFTAIRFAGRHCPRRIPQLGTTDPLHFTRNVATLSLGHGPTGWQVPTPQAIFLRLDPLPLDILRQSFARSCSMGLMWSRPPGVRLWPLGRRLYPHRLDSGNTALLEAVDPDWQTEAGLTLLASTRTWPSALIGLGSNLATAWPISTERLRHSSGGRRCMSGQLVRETDPGRRTRPQPGAAPERRRRD